MNERYKMEKIVLKAYYEKACNDYLKAFCKKHGFYFSDAYWVADEVGTVAGVADYFFDMQTIIADIDAGADKYELIKWYDYCLEIQAEATTDYKNWLKGCPRKSPEEIEGMKKHIEELKMNFVF
jgi:hypothetical protein